MTTTNKTTRPRAKGAAKKQNPVRLQASPLLASDKSRHLAELIESGTATERELGTANKAIQLMLAAQLSNGAGNLFRKLDRLNAMADKATEALQTRIDAGLDSWENKDLIDFLYKVQIQNVQTLELLRKITQGRTAIFNETLLSTDEKNVVNLFKSFKTEAQKREFLRVVEERMRILDARHDVTDIDETN